MGLCGHNLKEKFEYSNSIHDGKNWHPRIFFAQENLAACVVDGMHTIKTWTGLMRWNTYQGHESLLYYSFGGDLRSAVYVLLLQQKMSPYSLHVFWSLGPLGKICLLQKRLPLRAVKAMVIFHERCDCWCLYSCDYVSSENNI